MIIPISYLEYSIYSYCVRGSSSFLPIRNDLCKLLPYHIWSPRVLCRIVSSAINNRIYLVIWHSEIVCVCWSRAVCVECTVTPTLSSYEFCMDGEFNTKEYSFSSSGLHCDDADQCKEIYISLQWFSWICQVCRCWLCTKPSRFHSEWKCEFPTSYSRPFLHIYCEEKEIQGKLLHCLLKHEIGM